ncbi:general transcriptional corepressor CYC8-like [Lingula anatina]|uniref:General transcriptional corepressor CYC8-like n=1 Tax=Lingula anatina TaxID=7574 RepID=A0A1S3H6Z7_LINAN|nr:general transcriptional corepressor CYC8-like [Lingula anatina]|eukprot:XP_013381895.1 general transcriptional corepressor CYC8-like [Lingula anatina]
MNIHPRRHPSYTPQEQAPGQQQQRGQQSNYPGQAGATAAALPRAEVEYQPIQQTGFPVQQQVYYQQQQQQPPQQTQQQQEQPQVRTAIVSATGATTHDLNKPPLAPQSAQQMAAQNNPSGQQSMAAQPQYLYMPATNQQSIRQNMRQFRFQWSAWLGKLFVRGLN